MFHSGLWLSADETDRMAWSLTLSPQEPRVFGASCEMSAGAPTTTTCKLLSGHFDATAQTVRIVESSARDVNAPSVEYVGSVVHSADQGVTLQLTCEPRRVVVMRLEARNSALHHSGAWCGAASPAAELAPFGIPVNPCFWSLCIVPSARVVFGAGYFDDAGDVPGRPLLRFLLAGTVAQDDGRLIFRKIYEPSVADAPVVHYEARVVVVSDTETRLEGTWRNEDVFGVLGARLEHAPHCSPHMALCADCGALLSPGRPRWTCVQPTCDYIACTHCRKLDATECATATHVDGHRVVPSFTVQLPPMPRVHSVAELVHAALRLHSERTFMRWASDRSLTYGAAGMLVARVAMTLFERDAALRGNLIRARPLCLVVANQSPMANIVLLGAALAGYTVAHASASLPLGSLAGIVELLKPSAVLRSRDAAALGIDSTVFDADPEIANDDATSLNALIRRSTATLDVITPDRLRSTSVAVVLFTSGSSGVPKAARFSESLALPAAVESTVQPSVRLDFAPFDPSQMLSLLSTLTVGGERVIGTLEDAKWARPTVMGAPPSVWAQLARRVDVAAPAGSTPAQRRKAADAVRAALGNRLTIATSGGAALDGHVANVVKRDLRISLVELYATRETGGVARDGVVYPGVIVKLLPTEATASSTLLSSTDVGQICVHSPRLIDGYVDASHNQQFVEIDGKQFYCTGDIGEFVTDDSGVRRLRVIGRATEHSKRADGTWFVLPTRIEALLEQCAGVSRACVLALPNGVTGAVTVGACAVDEARLRLRSAGIAAQDVPTVFVTVEAPLAETPNGKLDRRAIRAQFEAELLASVPPPSTSSAPVSERLSALVRTALHLADNGSPLDGSATLYSIGGDSLAAVRLSRSVSIAVPTLLQLTLREIDVMFERGLSLSSAVATRSDDVLPDARLPPALLERLKRHAPSSSTTSNRATHVVVTGAGGFCGDAIVRELRARSIAVTRLVRRADANDASALVSDVRKRHLGIVDDEQYERLCAVATDVIHCAAQVDHLLPYAALRETNVLGTLNVLEFVADCRSGARLHLVSSIAALPAGDGADTERALSISQVQLQAKNGYGATKAVSELLVTAAAREAGLVVVVHRPGTVCASTDGTLVPNGDTGVALVRACATLNARPASASLYLCWTPVDAVARCVVGALVDAGGGASPRFFNLVAASAPTVDQVLVACERASGRQWRRLGVSQFANELQLLDDAHPSAPLKALGLRWNDDNSLAHAALVECRAAAHVLGDNWRGEFTVSDAMLATMAPGLIGRQTFNS